LTVLQKGRVGETYNVGGNSEKQNIEVVQTVCDILDGKTAPLASGHPRRSLIKFVKDRAGHDRRYAIDASKLKNELGWEPSVNFDDGIRMTVEWYLDNPEWVESVLDGSYQEYYEKMYGGR
jgi:dTDP-glucose 4,6-dehydratase